MKAPELYDILADYETRLCYLENLTPYRKEEIETPIEIPKVNVLFEITRLSERIQQLEARMLYLQNKVNELYIKKKGKGVKIEI